MSTYFHSKSDICVIMRWSVPKRHGNHVDNGKHLVFYIKKEHTQNSLEFRKYSWNITTAHGHNFTGMGILLTLQMYLCLKCFMQYSPFVVLPYFATNHILVWPLRYFEFMLILLFIRIFHSFLNNNKNIILLDLFTNIRP